MGFVAACVNEPLTDLWKNEWSKPLLRSLRYNRMQIFNHKVSLNINSMSLNNFYVVVHQKLSEYYYQSNKSPYYTWAASAYQF